MKIIRIVPISEQNKFKHDWLQKQAETFKKQSEEANKEAYRILKDLIGPFDVQAPDPTFGYAFRRVELTDDGKFVVLVETLL